MTHSAPALTDAALRQALRELAAGAEPTALTTDVLAAVATTPQVGASPWPAFTLGRRATLLVAASLLLAGLAGSLAALGGLLPRPVPAPFSPSTIVVQSGGPIWGTADVNHVAFAPGAAAGVTFEALPAAATEPRWSPDGNRMAYLTWGPIPADPGLTPQLAGLFVANGDGSEAMEVDIRAGPGWLVPPYGAGGSWHGGPQWSPSGEWFHLSYGRGYDLFDASGAYLWRLELDPLSYSAPVWSPDGSAIGWISEACADGSCATRAFNWRRVVEGGEVRSFALEPAPDERSLFRVSLTPNDRLLFVEDRVTGTGYDETTTAIRANSSALDGTDAREEPIPVEDQFRQLPAWSADGRRVATWDSQLAAVFIREVESGGERAVRVPRAFAVAGWSPSGDRLALAGPTQVNDAPFRFFVMNADGSGLQDLGPGSGFAWMPAEALAQED